MITDLFTAFSAMEPGAVAGAIPPTCRQPAAPPAVTAARESELVLEFGPWRPRVPARHLLPSLSALTDEPYGVRFEVSIRSAGRWSPWVATATLGPTRFADLPDAAAELTCDVDVYTAPPADEVRLRIRLGAADLPALMRAPWIATLSACDPGSFVPGRSAESVPALSVPARSQMEAPAEIARRICSPASVAMVLDYWGRPEPTSALASELYHAPTDT